MSNRLETFVKSWDAAYTERADPSIATNGPALTATASVERAMAFNAHIEHARFAQGGSI